PRAVSWLCGFLELVAHLLRGDERRRRERNRADDQIARLRRVLRLSARVTRTIDVAVHAFGNRLDRDLAPRPLFLVDALRARTDHLLLTWNPLARILAVR